MPPADTELLQLRASGPGEYSFAPCGELSVVIFSLFVQSTSDIARSPRAGPAGEGPLAHALSHAKASTAAVCSNSHSGGAHSSAFAPPFGWRLKKSSTRSAYANGWRLCKGQVCAHLPMHCTIDTPVLAHVPCGWLQPNSRVPSNLVLYGRLPPSPVVVSHWPVFANDCRICGTS